MKRKDFSTIVDEGDERRIPSKLEGIRNSVLLPDAFINYSSQQAYIWIYLYPYIHTRSRFVFLSSRWVTRCVADHNAMRAKKRRIPFAPSISYQSSRWRSREEKRETERDRESEKNGRGTERRRKKKSILNFFSPSCFVLSYLLHAQHTVVYSAGPIILSRSSDEKKRRRNVRRLYFVFIYRR